MERSIAAILNRLLSKPSRRARLSRNRPEGLFLGEGFALGSGIPLGPVILDSQRKTWSVVVAGATGQGKSKLLEVALLNELETGGGFSLIDPHGDLWTAVIARLASGEVELPGLPALLDLGPDAFSGVSLDPLQQTASRAHEVCAELVAIFRRIWPDSIPGARTEELLRNTLLGLAETGHGLLDAPRLLTEEGLRRRLMSQMRSTQAKHYWQRFGRLSARLQAVYAEPLLNRLGATFSHPTLQALFSAALPPLDVQQLMNQGDCMLARLSQTALKDQADFIGSLLVSRFKWASLSRAGQPQDERVPHTLYLDEGARVMGPEAHAIFAESRKYALSIVVAFQSWRQLSDEVRAAVLANVGTIVSFRAEASDAKLFASQCGPKEERLIEACLKTLPAQHAIVKFRGPERAFLLRPPKIEHVGQNTTKTQEFLERLRIPLPETAKDASPSGQEAGGDDEGQHDW
ncbi:MAG TPA: type IV secretory system conjugative DNA transfer family protein [Candidatus Xenobia bacterium]|nr:type IV secretory system conjugative DNA transfer family protein [Candidatus Xenobia bacterium]